MLQLTAATVSTDYSYGSSVKSASKDKERIIVQLLGLQKVLSDVQTLVVDDEAKTTPELSRLMQLLNSPEGLVRCRDMLTNLKAKLEPKHGRSRIKKVLSWPLQESDMRKTVEYLERFQESVQSAIKSHQTYVSLSSLP